MGTMVRSYDQGGPYTLTRSGTDSTLLFRVLSSSPASALCTDAAAEELHRRRYILSANSTRSTDRHTMNNRVFTSPAHLLFVLCQLYAYKGRYRRMYLCVLEVQTQPTSVRA